MRITSKGQVTIPKHVRDKAGLLPGTDVEFVASGSVVTIRRSESSAGKGARIVERLRGKGDIAMTTDEIMALMRGEG